MSIIISFDIGIKNLAYCIMKKNQDIISISEIEVVDLKCKKNDIQKIIDSTIELLDSIFDNLDTTASIHVLIESQMTSVMKCIQTVINVYFKLQKKYQSLNIETKYISAKHKLNLISKYTDYNKPNTSVNSQYRQNKIDSIHFGSWLLENKYYDENIINKIKLMKKKDDAFDTLLMCIYYIELKNF
jgi:uncharacterized protein YqgV (UPF0045/DUF77 family)